MIFCPAWLVTPPPQEKAQPKANEANKKTKIKKEPPKPCFKVVEKAVTVVIMGMDGNKRVVEFERPGNII